MSNFIPSKLSTTFFAPVSAYCPVKGRKYTLTHSDKTGELFLSIGCSYDYKTIDNKLRDEVLAEWVPYMGNFMLWGSVHVSGRDFDENIARIRYVIFQKELQLALTAIIYGDRDIYSNYPWLLDAPIYVRFESDFPQFNKVFYFGTPRAFLHSIYSNLPST